MATPSKCPKCGDNAWEVIDTPTFKALECRSCHNALTESGSSKDTGKHFSGFTFSAPFESDPNESDEDIQEHDFAIPAPLSPSKGKRSGVMSVRQSMAQPVRRPRWFESEEHVSFKFQFTPRGRAATPAAAAPAPAPKTAASPTQGPARGVDLNDLSDDVTAWQKLLASTLFLIKEDNMPLQPGVTKVLDLGLVEGRKPGGKHLDMKHQSKEGYEEAVGQRGEQAKRIKWRVTVRPVR